ncbi:cytochrome P450 [Tardiphaga robiniae]|jgi:cytochrome P450|uniref:Cytochrome P450 n=2 Tax=Tardiphaga TaxID=1395974 RepID=A0A7G6TSX1_9BRAD|nr:cytochrome P450 [Tardiphaga robiniae]QND69853.1 cytochrome P450 [Tardiphaga robiniae]
MHGIRETKDLVLPADGQDQHSLKLFRDQVVGDDTPDQSATGISGSKLADPNGLDPGGASAVDRFGRRLRMWGELVKYRLSCHVLSHLRLFKAVFAVLRVVRPITIVGNVLVATKASDVREVLERFDDFELGDTIEPGMPWGPFLMTVDGREQHAREREMLQSVVEKTDARLIRTIASENCQSCIEALKDSGQIDVVADLAEPVMVAVLAEYFGVPPLNGDRQRMAGVMRNLAGIIMVNPPVGSLPWSRSRADIADLTCQLTQQLGSGGPTTAAASHPSIPAHSLLARLQRRHGQPGNPPWFDEEWIRCYLTGLVATGGATIIRGVTHAVDQLLEQAGALAHAQALSAALERAIHTDQGSVAADAPNGQLAAAREALRGCIYEAMRFRPMLPLLVRTCPRDTIIANGTPRARRVPAGTLVLAPPLAAMFDSEAFPDPLTFRDRPIESYFHFGFGPRHCFGKYIADVVMLEIVRALMRLPGLARAPGQGGQVGYDGPAPCSLRVTFNANGSEPVH